MNFLFDFLFPRRCVNCGRLGKYICDRCVSMIYIIDTNKQVCPVCERPAINGETHPKCKTRFSLDGLTSFFVYDGPIKKAIKLLKYKLVSDLASELVLKAFALPPMEHRGFSKATPCEAPVILIPVPLHWRRQNWRGFNQSELLGRMISARLNTRFVPDLLIRKKYTQPQVELKGKERQENIENAFIINPRYEKLEISHWGLVIFDDVWTTGSTLRACALVLKKAKAAKVWGMTLAR